MKAKRILALMLVIAMLAIPMTAFAAAEPEAETTEASSGISTRAEQIRYYYREVDGRLQYRIWSITYGEWLTDWTWG